MFRDGSSGDQDSRLLEVFVNHPITERRRGVFAGNQPRNGISGRQIIHDLMTAFRQPRPRNQPEDQRAHRQFIHRPSPPHTARPGVNSLDSDDHASRSSTFFNRPRFLEFIIAYLFRFFPVQSCLRDLIAWQFAQRHANVALAIRPST